MIVINAVNQVSWGQIYIIFYPFNLVLALFGPFWALFVPCLTLFKKNIFALLGDIFLLSPSPLPRSRDPRMQWFMLIWWFAGLRNPLEPGSEEMEREWRNGKARCRWENILKYNITLLTCPWPSSCWSLWSWWTFPLDIAIFSSAKYVTLIMKSLGSWKITKMLEMRTNKPVVAPKRLPQNGGDVSHRLSAHQERWDPGCSTGRSAAPRSPPLFGNVQHYPQKLKTNSMFLRHTISSV